MSLIMWKVLFGTLVAGGFVLLGGGAAQAAADLRQGDRGEAVASVQERLDELGYFVGGRKGVYGTQTKQAVYALQKAAGIRRSGVVGPRTRHALRKGVRPNPLSSHGRLVEIDLDRQLLFLVQGGEVRRTYNVSTGSGEYYGGGRRAVTPRGTFHVYREIDGAHRAPLGVLYRPKYVVGGIAVHGSPSVPPRPASHGCVRVTNAAMDSLWRSGRLDRGTEVWIY